MTATAEPDHLFHPAVRAAAVAILLVVGLSAFEGLAVAAALPSVGGALGRVDLLPWVITGYLLPAGVTTVAAGALVDRHGARGPFLLSLAVFTVGGTLAGLAPSMPWLIAARAVQGAGAGAVTAVALTSVGLVFPAPLVGRAFAANTNVWGVMSVAGPALAALLLAVASWRWIFLLNLPLGAVALGMSWRALPDTPPAPSDAVRVRGRDLLGLAAFMGAVLVAVDSLGPLSILAIAAAAGLAGMWFVRARGRSDVLLAPRHVVDAPLGPLAWTVSLLLVGAIGVQTFVPLYVRGGLGFGTTATAGSVLFFVLGWTTGANLGTRLAARVGRAAIVRAGVIAVPASLAGIAGIVAVDGPLAALCVLLFTAGAGTGAATNAALTLLRTLAPPGELGRATAAHQFMRNLGFAVGNALAGAVILAVVGAITGDVEQVRSLLSDAAPAAPELAAALRTGFAVSAATSAFAASLAWGPWRALRPWLPGREGA